MKKAQIKKIETRERKHCVLEGKDRRFCFVQIIHGITDALWVCLKNLFCLTIISLLPVLCLPVYYDYITTGTGSRWGGCDGREGLKW